MSESYTEVRDPRPQADGPTLKREFTYASTVALAFGFISPIVALYTIFGLVLTAGGAAFWWGLLIALGFQLAVALVFAELVSVWPFAGGVYQWTRALVGNGPGWFAGWFYTWTLVSGLGAVSYGGGSYLNALLDVDSPTTLQSAMAGLAIMLVATLANTVGRKVMKILIAGSIIAELVGSVLIGTYLLIWEHNNDFSVLFSSQGASQGNSYLLGGAFAAVMALVGFSFFGFESAGAIAEEVRAPRRVAPRALVLSLVLVGVVVVYSALALILAVPDLKAVVAGQSGDPVVETLTHSLGDGVAKPLFALFLIGFLAAAVAIQAGASRVVFGLARDNAIPASKTLGRLSLRDALPINAIVLTGVLVGLLYLLSGSNIYVTLIGFVTGGFFVTFLFPSVAALVTRLRRRWHPGAFSLGAWGLPVNIMIVLWLVVAGVNVSWPRQPDTAWYVNWAVPLGVFVVSVTGAVVYRTRRNLMKVHERLDMRQAAAVTDD
ncbi:APC family permease [Streptomyces phaeochromogenes]